jgi:hypothetical protein
MQRSDVSRFGRFGRLAAFVVAAGGILGAATWFAAVRADEATNARLGELIALNHKFVGNTNCSSSSCHGKPQGAETDVGFEYSSSIWTTKDKHHESFNVLKNDQSKGIASKMSIADATTDDKCLSCHALNAPAAVRGPDFKIEEGNSCESCHGPAGDFSKDAQGTPHAVKVGDQSWAEARRAADGYDPKAKAKDDGFWDVKNVTIRAQNCAGCHLSIDAKLVTAGHPQPAFEIVEYSTHQPKHWVDSKKGDFHTKLWAAGQIVCASDAMKQLAERAGGGADDAAITSAFNQAMAHASMFQELVKDGGIGSSVAGDIDGALSKVSDAKDKKDMAGLKDAATAVAALADKVQPELKDYAPTTDQTKAMLAKVIAMDDLGKKYDRRGAEQQAYGAKWLYLSAAWDEKGTDTELPDDVKAAYSALYDGRAKPLGDDAAKFADAVAKIKAQ